MIKKSILACLCYFLISFAPALSGTIHPLTPDSKHIEYGKNFHNVVRLCGIYEDSSLFCASAVVIHKNWIVTAAHVVNKSKICLVRNNDPDVSFVVTEIICHKDFDVDKFGVADIALGYVPMGIELNFYPELYEEQNEVGKVCSISGYGFTGNFITGAVKSDGLRRAGSNRIDSIEKDLLICLPSNAQRTALEFIIASGDSGGGLFIANKLAGINSCILASDKNPNSSYTDEACHTRVSKYVPWIRETMEEKQKSLNKVFDVDK